MFQNQNKTNLSQEKDLKIEDFPIHTMKKDLKEVDNSTKNKESVFKDTSSRPATPKKETWSEAQKTSPFLQKIPPQPPSGLPVQGEYAHSESSSPIIKPIKNVQQREPVRLGKLFITALAISAFLVALGGSYYAWSTDSLPNFLSDISVNRLISSLGIGSYSKNTPDDNIDPATIEEPTPPVIVPRYSTDKPNYLNLDTENATPEKIEESLKKYVDEVNALKLTSPVEFVVVDSQNNPLTFVEFSNKAGLNLPESIMSRLEEKFSLFVYNDNEISKLGLVIAVKNATELKESLRSAEKNLVEVLHPLFLSKEFANDNREFSSSIYKETSIRYKSLISPVGLSVDYSIIDGKIVIGSSKMTLRAIVDYLKR